MGRFTLKDLGQAVSLRGARDYLIRHGWRVFDHEDRLVCEGPDDDNGQPIRCILPPSESYADYPYRLKDLLVTLGALEERPAIDIAVEMARNSAVALTEELVAALLAGELQLAPGKTSSEAIEELKSLLHNVEQGSYPYFGKPLESVALLATRLSRLLVPNDAAGRFLSRVCQRFLAASGLTLQFAPTEYGELFAVARDDDPKAPERVLDWLAERVERGPSAKPQAGRQAAESPRDSA